MFLIIFLLSLRPEIQKSMSDINDKKLIIGLKEGKRNSYKTLFMKYYAPFVRFVEKIIADRQSAEDIIQDVFTRIYLNRDSLDENLCLENYIFVLARNSALNYLKSHNKVLLVEYDDDMVSSVRSDSDTIANELADNIKDEIHSMPEKRRKVFLLSRKNNLSNKEIARNMNISEKTVERHITLALSELRKNLLS